MNITLQEQAMLTTLLTQPHRTYHNLNHVNDCLTELRRYELATNTHRFSNIVENAIWYHDIIYNPYNPPGENEKQSADAFFDYKGKKLRDSICVDTHEWDFVHDVNAAILATANHIVTQSINDYSTKLMLDIDLSGLGKSEEIFYRNSVNIFHEYYNTPLIDIIKGRLQFLKLLNLRPSFYYTEYFRDLYHTQSKENVEKDIKLLEDSLASSDPEEYYYYITSLAGSILC